MLTLRSTSSATKDRVPLASITSVERRDAGTLTPAGVQLAYPEAGKPRTFWMAAGDPAVLVAAIERARSTGTSPKRVRVEPIESEEVLDEENAEASRKADRAG